MPPPCGNKRCVAICVCFDAAFYEPAAAAAGPDGDEHYALRDDDSCSVATEVDEDLDSADATSPVCAISLWDEIDDVSDYDSDVDDDASPTDEHTPVPPAQVLLPPRKRQYSPSTMLPPRKRPLRCCFEDVVQCTTVQ